MSARTGPRPWPIRAFAALFAGAALLSFADGMAGLSDPALPRAIRDAAIIGSSVRLTIALMTTGLVWFFAFRLARWLVPAFLFAKAAWALAIVWQAGAADFVSSTWLAAMALGFVAAIMLFVPAADGWFSKAGEPDPAVFR
ncbi:hypothetical protein N0B51_02960 [Tsuneonella sp. YG55]|uniref:Uncharacterized protein n=1 Tax=Tsuneonella litorea TaxID=2976475 RepID=A0A9X2VYZ3_9SPHN|nr:hypothetical protein [Tsuneonella litorea]MCT2557937.1 hypothetical protein [Tsuneonella litorea]